MYIHFTFADGSNPYICKDQKTLWKMINAFFLEQTGASSFCVQGRGAIYSVRRLSAREKKQAVLRNFAQEWQFHSSEFSYSWREFCDWTNFFEEYGRKYGLLREFRENGIC